MKNDAPHYCAVVKKVERYPSVVKFIFCYTHEDSGWPTNLMIETSVYDSTPSLYREAVKLKKGDMILVNSQTGHEVVECQHLPIWKRLKNLLTY